MKKHRKITIAAATLMLIAGIAASGLRAQETKPAQDPKPFMGDWKGLASIAGMEIEIILHFTLNAEKQLTGTLDVPAQGAAGLNLGDFKIEGKTISFTIPDAPGDAMMKVTVDETGKKMTGTVSQSGMEGAFTAEKQ
jgi:hypothetical protein